jgi:hypothetical protein
MDGHAGSLIRRIEDQLWRSFLPTPRSTFAVQWNEERRAMRAVRVPAANRGLHPWLPLEIWHAKKPFRVVGNRWIRRTSKVELQKWARHGDDYVGVLPVKKDGWDWWDIL